MPRNDKSSLQQKLDWFEQHQNLQMKRQTLKWNCRISFRCVTHPQETKIDEITMKAYDKEIARLEKLIGNDMQLVRHFVSQLKKIDQVRHDHQQLKWRVRHIERKIITIFGLIAFVFVFIFLHSINHLFLS